MIRRGFTLVELLITLSIMGVIAGIVVGSFAGARSSQILQGATDETLATLAAARARALASRGGNRYGVHIASDAMTLFIGPVYQAATSTNEKYALDSSLEIASVSLAGGGSDIVFEKLTGKTNQYGSFVLRLKAEPVRAHTISVSATGVASVQ